MSDLFPGSARVTVSEVLTTLSIPVHWIERGLGWRFGGRNSLVDTQQCIGDHIDNRRRINTCIRDEERYIPLPDSHFRAVLYWNDDTPCTVQLEDAEFERFLPTQLGLELEVEASAKRIFAVANSDRLDPRGVHTYLLDEEGCAFAKQNNGSYKWRLLLMKGFSNDLADQNPEDAGHDHRSVD
ncbi:MAG: hypothetical protein R3C52_07485 [Hyphomonadaceae bacterium]